MNDCPTCHAASLARRAALVAASLVVLLLPSAHGQEKPAAPDSPSRVPRAEPSPAGAILFHEKSRLPLPDGYRLLYEQSFEDDHALRDFVFSDPQAWRSSPGRSSQALELARQSRYQPPVRSPVNLALLSDRVFGDFILEADLVQTGREYGHRDMCIYFGFQNPTNFYYVHIATAADDHAHNIFIVKNAPRLKIARQTTKGVNWGLDVWHRVRLERRLSDGSIRVFFDDLTKPLMIAEDQSFGTGHLGFGSFDDTGKIDNIRIWGPAVESRPLPPFPSPP